MAFRKYLHVVERRGPSRRAILALLEGEAGDKTFWADRARVSALAGYLNESNVTATVVEDQEHQALAIELEDRSAGYGRRHRLDIDFVTTGEFRTLASVYQSVRDLMLGPVTIRTTGLEVREAEDMETAEEGTSEATEPARTPKAEMSRAESNGREDKRRAQLKNLDEFIDHFIALGRKGVAINRYKGLGEMNPETLWSTTMNPDIRTLLQVRAEDHTEADQMFTTLMGDQVEPRRKFIEDNALDVKNLDI